MWRLRVYPMAILVALAAAIVLAVASYDVADSNGRLGGDYPAFYGAGAIVADGDWDDLYTAERQRAEQAGLIDDEGGYLYFSYPPFVGGLYGLLAQVGYQWSFLLHTLLMAAALGATVWALWPWLRRTGWPPAALTVVGLAFYPVFRAVSGGQNTTLSLLLIAAAARLDHDERPIAGGLVAALLLFKPQFGIVVLPLLIVARRWRLLAGWVAGAASLFAISTALMGGAWISDWWARAGEFSELNVVANGANFISLPGFLENAIGAGSSVARVLGFGLALLVGLAVAWAWWSRQHRDSLQRWGLVAAAVVVVAPQTLFYDAGLLLLPLVAVVPVLGQNALRWVGSLVLLSWTQVGASRLEWSPLGPIGFVAVALFVWWVLRERSAGTGIVAGR